MPTISYPKIMAGIAVFLLGLALCFGYSTFMPRVMCPPKDFTYGDASFQVEVSRYRNHLDSKKSLVIVPPTGGTNAIDRSYAGQFCEEGYDVYVLNAWTQDTETRIDLDIHQSFYSKAQKAISLVIEQIKSPYIGLIGTSVGGLHASIAANIQDRLNAVFVIVGGAPIAEVVAKSNQLAMRKLSEGRKKKYGFKNDAEHIAAIEGQFALEPMLLGEKYKMKDLGMVIAEQDETVPYGTQIKLKNFWMPKTVILESTNHFWGIVKTWLFERQQILQFFEDSFKKTAVRQ